MEQKVRLGTFQFAVILLFVLSQAHGNAESLNLPIAHWAFNEMAGTVVHDSSNNRFDGELINGTWAQGATLYDGAVDFDGSSTVLFVPAHNEAPPDKIGALPFGSLAIRFRFPATGSGAAIPLFYFGAERADQSNISLVLEIGHGGDVDNRRLYFTIINVGFCFDTGVNLLPDTWYQFVGVVGTNGNTGYLNGLELTNRHYNLGSNRSYTNFFSSVPIRDCLTMGYGRLGVDKLTYGPATISDVRIYDRPLTATEVNQLYSQADDEGLFKVNTIVRSTNGAVNLTWASASNYVYSVFRAETPTSPAWNCIPGFDGITATPPINSLPIPIPAGNAFYRVRATRISPVQ